MFEGFKSRWKHRAFRRRMMAASVLGVLALGAIAVFALTHRQRNTRLLTSVY